MFLSDSLPSEIRFRQAYTLSFYLSVMGRVSPVRIHTFHTYRFLYTEGFLRAAFQFLHTFHGFHPYAQGSASLCSLFRDLSNDTAEFTLSIPDLDKILKLSALFEVSTDYLLKDELEQPDATAPLPKEERVTEPCRTVSFDEANAYLSTVQAVHGKMAAGVGLCILSPIPLLVLGAWSDGTPSEERMAGLGVIFLLLFIALGLLLILPAAIRLEAFEYLEKEQIALAYGVEGIVERQKQEYAPTYRRSMTQGVVLCVLAVVPILGTAMLGVPDFWVAAAVGLLLAIVAGAVQLFIRAGMTQGSFDKLLQAGEYTVREKWTNRRVGWFAGAYWCLVTAVYLAVSFWNNNWEKSWIIWAVAGLVFVALYSAVRAWADRKNQ